MMIEDAHLMTTKKTKNSHVNVKKSSVKRN